MPAIIVIGEALVDLFAEPGAALTDLPRFTPRLGGAPANVAAAVARLGGDVGFVGKVGDDGFGNALATHFEDIGVDVIHLNRASRPTMVACVALPSPAQPEFVLFEGANAELSVDDIDVGYIESSKVVAFGSITLAYSSREAVLHAAQMALRAGCKVVFDVNLRPAIWPDMDVARERILEAIALASVVKFNEEEARFLFGDIGIEAAASEALNAGPELCCVSLGERGAYFRAAAAGHVAGYSIEVVDTTGCGDAFLAGLSLRLAEALVPLEEWSEDDFTEAIAFANACGAVVATELGAMDAPLTRMAAEALMAAAPS
jgi:fructokinase